MSVTNTMTFNKLVGTLDALKAQGVSYKIIADGIEFGDLPTATQKVPKRKYMFNVRPKGSITATYRNKLEALKSGELESLEVPVLPNVTPSSYQSHISAWCCTHWGKGNYMISRNESQIEVLRIK